ncbi:hypothetical protein D3C87_1325680 [compost metagenome]
MTWRSVGHSAATLRATTVKGSSTISTAVPESLNEYRISAALQRVFTGLSAAPAHGTAM